MIKRRARAYGISPRIYDPGPNNALNIAAAVTSYQGRMVSALLVERVVEPIVEQSGSREVGVSREFSLGVKLSKRKES